MSAQLTQSDLQDNRRRFAGAQLQSLLENLIEQSPQTLLGLRSADFVIPGSYDVLGFLVMSCSTLDEAIQKIQPYEKLVGDMGPTSVHLHGELLSIRWHCVDFSPEVQMHLVDISKYSTKFESVWHQNF